MQVFFFFIDDEIHTVRQNFQEKLEAEKTKIIELYEGEDGKLATMLCEQRKETEQKVRSKSFGYVQIGLKKFLGLKPK